MFDDAITDRIAHFLRRIGIEVVATTLQEETFLPGILVQHGRLLVDETKLTYPGDLLHEAGHLAVAPSHLRHQLSGEIVIPGADMNMVEVQATAWAYAALKHLELEPEILFHEAGYRGKSAGLIRTYGFGVYPGANLLEDLGMTLTKRLASESNLPAYPHMLRWLRE
jgi:hypothetical protein